MTKANKPQPLCVPHSAGLSSEPRAVGRRLGELLTALGRVDRNLASGTLPDELWNFRADLHTRLQAEGWRIKASTRGDGWTVLPPLARKVRA